MAKRHVNLYFLQQQALYFEMLENLTEFKELAAQGKVSQEEYDQMVREVDLVRTNYERLAFIMLLLNKPNRKSKEDHDMNKSWYASLSGSSSEVILDESRDVLADLKKLIAKGKSDNE